MRNTYHTFGIRLPLAQSTVFTLSALLAIMTSFFWLDIGQKLNLFMDYAYYIVGLSFLLAVFFSVKPILAFLKSVDWRKADVLALSVLAIIFGYLFHLEENSFKVVMDEVLLLATSKNLSLEASPTWATYGYWFDGEFQKGGLRADKRPILFPFLLSILHTLFGFCRENAFILNNTISALIVLGFYGLLRKFSSTLLSFSGALLFLSIPEFIITGNGGGFGPLNLLVLIWVVYTASIYLEKPNKDNLNALIFSGVLLSQVRPESVTFIFGVIAVILIGIWKNKHIPLSFFAAIAPWICSVYILQKAVLERWPSFWQDLGAYGLLSKHYFMDNVNLNLKYFFNLGFDSSNSFAISILLIVACIAFTALLCNDRSRSKLSRSPIIWVFGVFIIIAVAQFVLFQFYYAGHVYKLTRSRYTLPLCLLACAFIIYLVTNLRLKSSQTISLGCLCLALGEFSLLAAPAAANEWRAKYALVENWKYDFIEKHQDERFLIIGDINPIIWIVFDKAVVPLFLSTEALPKIKYLMDLNYFEEVYYIHANFMDVKNDQWEEIKELRSKLTLEAYSSGAYAKDITAISRVTGIMVEPIFPPENQKIGPNDTKLLHDPKLRQRILSSFPVWLSL